MVPDRSRVVPLAHAVRRHDSEWCFLKSPTCRHRHTTILDASVRCGVAGAQFLVRRALYSGVRERQLDVCAVELVI